ncbi:50S ribosomal protein L17 [Candidatus Kapabacteria bacterium]|nr:50S ribosomal protein L17 [Candidatus Kapabacteria bacterium]
MRHRVTVKKLGRTKSHREATLRALVTALLENKRIHTTEAKARALRPYAEKLITRARKAYLREQQGQLSEGSKHDLNTRRGLANHITKKTVIENLFDEIIPEISDRPGGYTRIVKTGYRRGDSGSKALIELVDYNREQTETVSLKPKKKKSSNKKQEAKVVEPVQEVAEVVEETIEDVVDTAEAVSETIADVTESVVDTVTDSTEDSETKSQSESTDEDTSSESNDEDKTV